jgi:hypothetical protein
MDKIVSTVSFSLRPQLQTKPYSQIEDREEV